jgi:hypothetical protein
MTHAAVILSDAVDSRRLIDTSDSLESFHPAFSSLLYPAELRALKP